MIFQDRFINLKHPMRFESQTRPQDDHIDRITDYVLDMARLKRYALA